MSIIGLVVFVLITGLVQVRALAGFDYAVAAGVYSLDYWWLDPLSSVVSIAFSAEFSVLYALVASLVLWRLGFGLWSLAPWAFLPVVPVEILIKNVVYQPAVPPELQHFSGYSLTNLEMKGAFPSGHAMRCAFFYTFLGVMALRRGWRLASLALPVLVLLAGLTWLTRIYWGSHWTSDVVAGLILGWSTALVVAPGFAHRLIKPRTADRG